MMGMLDALTAKAASAVGPAGLLAFFALVLVGLIRAVPPMFKTKVEADGSLRADLLGQIKMLNERHDKLEAEIRTERERCDAEMQAMRANHDAVIQIFRHRLNNETMSLDALLMLMEAAPDKVADNVAKIKLLRAERAQTIALEQGAIAGAKVAGKDHL